MIKFFRKIRQKLLSENKVSKYLIYAIGEVILVVIGILIALQINNWNQKNIDRDYELTMLQEVNVALEKDISGIESQLEYLEKVKQSARKLAIIQNEPLYPEDSLYYHFEVVRKGGIGFSINSSPYESLKSSGLDKVSNPELRNNISYLYEIRLSGIDFWINDFILKRLEKKSDLINEMFEKKVVPDSIKGINIEYLVDYNSIYKNPKTSDFLAVSGGYIAMANRRLNQALDYMKVIEEQIENELKKCRVGKGESRP